MSSPLKSRKLERQQFAYDSISALDLEVREKYKNRCEQVAMLVYSNSLVSTAALLRASKEKADKKLYQHLHDWLSKIEHTITSDVDLLKQLLSINLNTDQLRRCTKEVMILTDHLKEMAKAQTN